MHAAAPTPSVLYSRHEHGGHPVRVGDGSYEVIWPTGAQSYDSRQALLRALYNNGDTSRAARRGMSFERYFKVDAPPPSGGFGPMLGLGRSIESDPARAVRTHGLTVARAPRGAQLRRRAKLVVEAPWWDGTVMVGGLAREMPVGSWARGGLTVVKPPARRRPTKLTIEAPVVQKAPNRQAPVVSMRPNGDTILGIDLETRGHEVRKLLFACFGMRLTRLGYDPLDVLQEVYKGLLVRNRGTCPWDKRKSSFGHYVHMVIECVLRNYTRKHRRIGKHEQVGAYTVTDDGWCMIDAAHMAVDLEDGHEGIEDSLATNMALTALEGRIMDSGEPEAAIAVLALPHVTAGHTRKAIAEILTEEIGETVKSAEVGAALNLLRRVTQVWATETGLR